MQLGCYVLVPRFMYTPIGPPDSYPFFCTLSYRLQIQLKGIGKTPFSRGGDGKAGEATVAKAKLCTVSYIFLSKPIWHEFIGTRNCL